MADQRDGGIAWSDETWNPIRGCSRVSQGCVNCYAEAMASRFCGPGQPYEGLARDGRWTGSVRFVDERLDDPLRWRRPRRVFVNSMSDMFHEQLTDEAIDRVFGVMINAQQHTFQVLTKRSARLREYLTTDRRAAWARAAVESAARHPSSFGKGLTGANRDRVLDALGEEVATGTREVPNVWIGVSVEDERAADRRVLDLAAAPAAVRFLSCEPLLGPVVLGLVGILPSTITGTAYVPLRDRLSWVIVGGESGPGARACRIEWVRDLVRECRDAEVAVFVKQLGALVEAPDPLATNGSGWRVPGTFPRSTIADAPDWRRIGDTDRWRVALRHPKGGDPSEWPVDLRVRQLPEEAR